MIEGREGGRGGNYLVTSTGSIRQSAVTRSSTAAVSTLTLPPRLCPAPRHSICMLLHPQKQPRSGPEINLLQSRYQP